MQNCMLESVACILRESEILSKCNATLSSIQFYLARLCCGDGSLIPQPQSILW